MMAFIIVRYLGFGPVKWSNLKEQLDFAIPTIPSNVSSWVVDSSDKYVIGIIAGSVAFSFLRFFRSIMKKEKWTRLTLISAIQ